ncbi:hypothetical protein Slin15195_G070700 [Septoria linicola]|uniref:Uncharacterized protein n=1 Tax=Septoria linicola TaxID=215465 RepID=A0A9Q9AXS6_9PEZI|nr:hypothetical protein Slin15195_G070700 [Septoria linicola]
MPSPERPAPTPPALDKERRHSMSSDRSLTATSDHSATPASPRQLSRRAASPTSRLLAQTHASAAKFTPTSLRRKPLPSPRPLSFSKIPRRDASLPTASTPATRWGARVAQRVNDAEESNRYARRTPSTSSTARHPASVDKPLPPKPIATLTSTASPSKDSRTLLDASERPLHRSVDGRTLEWPAINPSRRSVSAPEQQSIVTDDSTVPSSLPHKTSSSQALSELATSTHGRRLVSSSSGLSCRSSIPSFVSAEESVGRDVHSDTASVLDVTPHKSINESTSLDTTFPPRSHSLTLSIGDVTTSLTGAGSDAYVPPLPARAKDIHTPAPDSSKQASSTANFSRPHSTAASIKTSHSTPTSIGAGLSARQQKTASRIPLPGSTKAKLVSIHNQNPSLDTRAPVQGSPSFGARRLISPDALAVLELGTKRRLQRANTNGSVASDNSHFLPPPIRALRASSRSRSSSPAATVGASTDDEDEVTTPISQPSLPRSASMAKLTPPNPETDQYEPFPASPLDIHRTRRNPPSKSRHTKPLQTIPSQSALTEGIDMELPLTTNYSTVADRLSQAKRTSINPANPFIGATDTELRRELTFVRGQDDARVKSGLSGLDKEAKGVLDHTLGCLEGAATPPVKSVDPEQLNDLFGHLTWRSNRVPKTNTFIDNAAAAAMFVDRGSVSSEQIEASTRARVEHQKAIGQGRQDITAELPADEAEKAPIVTSTWSNSTPSALGDLSELSHKQQTSIGYPSAMQTPRTMAESTTPEAKTNSSAFASRTSSPTLGSSKHYQAHPRGSVRRARENLAERSGLSRPSVPVTSKKTTRAPTSVSRGTRRTEGSARGRDSNATSARTKSPYTANVIDTNLDRTSRTECTGKLTTEPRSRSKSRTVLAKINGFFSHKRDKKSQQIPIPALPSAELKKAPSMATIDVEIDNSEPFRRTPTPPVPAVPTNIPSQPELPRSPSRATNVSELSLSSIYEGTSSVVTLAEKLINKAKLAGSSRQKARLFGFAKVLNEVVLNAKEARISAETARQAAIEAEMSYQMTKKGLDMMEKLASSLVKSGIRH